MTVDILRRAEEIVSKLDPSVFAERARWAALRLRIGEIAHFIMEPGDHTSYRFLIVPPDPPGVHGPPSRDYLVILTNSFGAAYKWSGQPVGVHYATEKWTRPWNPPVGAVVARLLNEIAAVYGA